MAKLQIPISKGTDLFIEVDTDELMDESFPVDSFKEILFQGLKQVLNRGQSKLASSKGLPEKEQVGNNAALLSKAEETLEAMRKGEIRVTGGKSKSKASGAVKTEAMRIARALVKDALKRDGKKVSHIAAKEITAAAKELIEGEYGPEIIAQAEATIKAREAEEAKIKIDVSKVKVDPNLVAAAEKKKAESKKATQAKKAGTGGPAVRQKPGAEQRAAH